MEIAPKIGVVGSFKIDPGKDARDGATLPLAFPLAMGRMPKRTHRACERIGAKRGESEGRNDAASGSNPGRACGRGNMDRPDRMSGLRSGNASADAAKHAANRCGVSVLRCRRKRENDYGKDLCG